jgi:hypothetical protein
VRAEDWRAALEKGLELGRFESRRLLAEAGVKLKAELIAGRLQLAIDRGFARQFLSDPRSEPLGRSFGVSLRSSRLVVNAFMVLEPLCIVGLAVLSVRLIGPWGLASLLVLPLLVWRSWRSAQIPRRNNRLPKVLMVILAPYGGYATWGRLPTPHLAVAILGCMLFWVTILKYAYPTWRIRTLAMKHVELLPALVEANVVFVRKPDEAARSA